MREVVGDVVLRRRFELFAGRTHLVTHVSLLAQSPVTITTNLIQLCCPLLIRLPFRFLELVGGRKRLLRILHSLGEIVSTPVGAG